MMSWLLVLLCIWLCWLGGCEGWKLQRPALRRLAHLHLTAPDSNTDSTSKPNVIIPNRGTSKLAEDKFMMMYTCKVCNGRNAQMISKVAYQSGMVISTCRSCKNRHLIADNERKLDMAEYGSKIEEYLQQRGERVVKMSITLEDLEENYLVDRDGVLSLIPKKAGQPPPASTIIEYPKPQK